jgi:hypothetical protein
MSFLKRLFQPAKSAPPAPAAEQAVLIYLDGATLPDEVYAECDLSTLEDRLIAALEGSGLGEFDGNEVGERETILYLYGSDAERLYQQIGPVLTAYPLCRNARVVIRKGRPGAAQREFRLPTA